ncbi:diguanylate cyclase [Conexibacter woesei]|uniref:diguanylate cyclase n=1 Tax=Conexibacter woesei TaxID=191495 RepID=UPI0003F8359F|nr:diguanylate cyclase [Conexibacter woesei]
MPQRSQDSLIAHARTLARILAALVAAIGVCTLLGRATGIALIGHLTPGSPSMLPGTALALTLYGAALFVHARPSRDRTITRAARTAATLAVLTTVVCAVVPLPHRITPTALAALLALGLALELDRRRRADGRLVNAIALAPLVIGLVGVAAYVSGIGSFTGTAGSLRVALATALALVAAGGSLLLARPSRGTVRLLVSAGPGGILARRLLPMALAIPLGLDALRSAVSDAGLVEHHVGDWLYAVALVITLGAVVLRLATRLNVAEVGRRAVEERLRSSEAIARSVTDTANDAIVSADANGWITLFNPAAERLFGWAAAEVMGRPVTLLMPERYRTPHRDSLRRSAHGAPLRLAGVPLELHGITKAGREFDLEISFARVDGAEGFHVTAIMRDISPRKMLERIAREDSERIARVVSAQTAIAGGSGELVATLDLVAAQAAAIVGGDGAVVELPDGDDMVYRAGAGAGAAHLGTRIAIEGSLSGSVLRSGESAFCLDCSADPRVNAEACARVGVGSMVCVALRHQDEAIGVLKVYAKDPHSFADRDVQTLELLAGLAAATVHRAQVERRLAALHAAGAELGFARSLQDGLVGALRGTGEQLGWNAGAIWLSGAADGSLTCAGTWHAPGLPVGPFLELVEQTEEFGTGTLIDAVRRSGARAWVEHVESTDPDATPDPRRIRAAATCGLRTLTAVPIVARGQTLGVLELGALEARSHDSATLDLIDDVAAAVAQFVQRRDAEERITTQATNLAAVAELSATLSHAGEPEQTRPLLVGAIRDLARADSVMLFEPDGPDHLAISAEAGGLVDVGRRVELHEHKAVVAEVFLSGRGRFVGDYLSESSHWRALREQTGLRSAHYEPVLRDGVVAGVLVIATCAVRPRDHRGLDQLMRLLAGEAGTALALSDLVASLDALARTDQLTGLANRRTWDDELPRELARARRNGEPLSVAILDLDRFKSYNDTYGHPAGDRLLRGAAAAWTERLRTTDLLARYGGEEFAVLLPGCDTAAAAQVVEHLRAAVPDDETCSIGLATWDGDESCDTLVARADTALYRAKDGGRNRVVAAA